MTRVSFEHISIKDTGEALVDLRDYPFVLYPAYFHQGLSSTKSMFLRKSVVERLLQVQNDLNGYRFKIWDGFRSREVQNNIYQRYWNKLKTEHGHWSDEKLDTEVSIFVTNPDKTNRIPPHATGGAVDLTLVDSDGNELDMGTAFDHFGPESAPFYFEEQEINEKIKQNRKLLREAMLAAEFRNDTDEWWHFDYGNQIWAHHYHKPFAIFGEAKENKL